MDAIPTYFARQADSQSHVVNFYLFMSLLIDLIKYDLFAKVQLYS